MSALQRIMVKGKLPPRAPETTGKKLAPFMGSRRKDYTPISWREYFSQAVDMEVTEGVFRVYTSPESDYPNLPRIVTLHGGGYSGLSWALFTKEITSMIECQVISMDIRGHGETKAKKPDDLNGDILANDVLDVLKEMFGNDIPPIVLIGHSMGGAVAVRAAHLPGLAPYVQGLAVIDVVEGTAMEALTSMQSFLRGRPTHFRSIEHAIEWCIRSGQVRNVDSARVSMPSQIVNCETGLLATNEIDNYTPEMASAEVGKREPLPVLKDCIQEEDETAETSSISTMPPPPVTHGANNMKYKWRVELSRTEQHWAGWFQGLSAAFLSTRAPRLLLLASIEGLDRELTVGQMQGKFQMQVLARCGHAVHEDSPHEVAQVLASFLLRHQLTFPKETAQLMDLDSPFSC